MAVNIGKMLDIRIYRQKFVVFFLRNMNKLDYVAMVIFSYELLPKNFIHKIWIPCVLCFKHLLVNSYAFRNTMNRVTFYCDTYKHMVFI